MRLIRPLLGSAIFTALAQERLSAQNAKNRATFIAFCLALLGAASAADASSVSSGEAL